jgi:hypothetical protein
MPSGSDQSSSPSFWARQLAVGATRWQLIFDFCVGVLVPVVGVLRDPVVFHASHNRAVLGEYRVAGQIATGIGILSLTGWIAFRRPAALFVGLLGPAAVFAVVLGLLLLPVTLARLMALTDFTGLVPFLVALVFFRNGYRALAQARSRGRRTSLLARAVLSFFVSCAAPWTGQVFVNRQIADAEPLILSINPADVSRGVAVLRSLRGLYDADRIILEYQSESIPVFRYRMARAYQKITDEDIEWRIILRDMQ